MMTSLPGQRRSIAYPSHDSSLRTRPKGRAARLKPAGGDKSTKCFFGFFSGTATELMRDGCSNNAREKTTHHGVKIHWHKINRQQQSSVYHSFKQTGHYTRYSNRGRRNNSFSLCGLWMLAKTRSASHQRQTGNLIHSWMKTGLQTHAAGRHRQKIHWQRRSLPSGLSRIKVVCCLLVQTLFLVAVFCFYVKKKKEKRGKIPANLSVTQSIWQRRRSKRPDSTVEEKSIHGAERMGLSSQTVLLQEKMKHFGWEDRKRETTKWTHLFGCGAAVRSIFSDVQRLIWNDWERSRRANWSATRLSPTLPF